MFPLLQIGPLSLQAAGFFLILAAVVAMFQIEKFSVNAQLDPEVISSLTFWAIAAGLIGARIFYLMQTPGAFWANPLIIFSLNLQMFDVQGGILVGGLTALIYGQRKGISLWRGLDVFSIGAAVIWVGLGVANLATGDSYGIPTNLPWGIDLWGASRQPTQVYEILAGLGLLFLLIRKIKQANRKPGEVFFVLLIFGSSAVLVIDAFREDTIRLSSGIHLVQIIAWLLLAGSLFAAVRLRHD